MQLFPDERSGHYGYVRGRNAERHTSQFAIQSGSTLPTALAAPVEDGMMFWKRRGRRASLCETGHQRFSEYGSSVNGGHQTFDDAEVIVDTLASGARQLVVQDALETMSWQHICRS